jgi:transcriptional regulator with XRE-family HTH domain
VNATTSAASRLSELRSLRGFKTPTALGRKAGVSRRTIIEYEAARASLSTDDAIKLADALEVSVDVLLGRGPLPPSNLDEVDVLRLYGSAVGVNLEVAEDEGPRAVVEVFVNMHSDDPHPIWLEILEGNPEAECQGA